MLKLTMVELDFKGKNWAPINPKDVWVQPDRILYIEQCDGYSMIEFGRHSIAVAELAETVVTLILMEK